jgi:hypothetical protein
VDGAAVGIDDAIFQLARFIADGTKWGGGWNFRICHSRDFLPLSGIEQEVYAEVFARVGTLSNARGSESRN